jgi:hypothetical protein
MPHALRFARVQQPDPDCIDVVFCPFNEVQAAVTAQQVLLQGSQLLLFRHHPKVVPLSVVGRNVRAVHVNRVAGTALLSQANARESGRGTASGSV